MGFSIGGAIAGAIGDIANTLIGGASAYQQGFRNYGYSKKLMERQWEYEQKAAAMNYNYQQRAYRESPAAQVAGLRAAGLNPLLAVGSGINAPSSGVSVSAPSPSGGLQSSSGSSALDVSKWYKLGYQKEMMEAELATAKANAKAAEWDATIRGANANVALSSSARDSLLIENELRALEDDARYPDGLSHINGNLRAWDSPLLKRLRQAYINSAERQQYLNSQEHAIWEDSINAIHGINGAVNLYRNFRGGKRGY